MNEGLLWAGRPPAGGRPSESKALGQARAVSGRAAGLAKYGGPTWAHVTSWAGLILLVFLGRRELLCCTLGWI